MKRIVLAFICILNLFNISCNKKIDVPNNDNIVEERPPIETQIEENEEWGQSLEEKYINIINEGDEIVEEEVITKEELRYFSSQENSPLDILIGRWYLVDYDLANKEYNSYFDIYYSGSEYRFNNDYVRYDTYEFNILSKICQLLFHTYHHIISRVFQFDIYNINMTIDA